MSNREFVQWSCFHGTSPIDDERCYDIGPALIRQMLVATNGGDKPVPPLRDFLPFVPQPSATNEVDAALIAWAKTNGNPA